MFEVLTEVMLKFHFSWHISPCRLVNSYRFFESTKFLHISLSTYRATSCEKHKNLNLLILHRPGRSNQNGRQQRKLQIKNIRIEFLI